jgi:hypothetical protein
MTRFEIDESNLSAGERRFLRDIAAKAKPAPRQALPPGYAEEIERMYGDCGEGEVDRWKVQW